MTAEAKDIHVETHEDGPIQRRVEVEVAPKRVKKAFDRAYKDLARRVPVKGFRPGKAPRSVLERLYGASIAEQIEQTLVAETLGDAVELAGVEPVAEPAIEADAPQPDASFRYVARIEVKPPVELPDLAGLAARKPVAEVDDEQVQKELDQLQERQAQLVEEGEGTALAEGHTATIDFVGRIDGEAFEGGKGEGVDLELGGGQFIPGFEEQLVGVRAGEDLEVRVSFPDDYHASELAGKEAVFATHVVAVKRRQVPELDDEFAKDLGDFETLEDLRARIREDLEKAREHESKQELHRTVMDSLIERAPLDVPPGMVERQLEGRLRQAHQRFGDQIPHEVLHQQLDRWREEWREGAERQVRESLLLEAVAESENLSVSPEDVSSRVQEMAQEQGVDAERLLQAYGGEGFEGALEAQLRDEKALEFLVARAKVEETTDT
jgi:trigger factor